MEEIVTWVSGEGYFGIKGHFGITSMDRGYLNVSVLHRLTPVRGWRGRASTYNGEVGTGLPEVGLRQRALALRREVSEQSGTFFDLVAVINQNGKPAPLAPRLLGDRVLIHTIGIDHRQIQIVLDTRSKHAPMTRRDTRSDRTFEVRGNRLVLVHESDRPISPVG
jgi:hypothetical protein